MLNFARVPTSSRPNLLDVAKKRVSNDLCIVVHCNVQVSALYKVLSGFNQMTKEQCRSLWLHSERNLNLVYFVDLSRAFLHYLGNDVQLDSVICRKVIIIISHNVMFTFVI